ncbi:TPM domain-containing protein [Oribacterium sp. WCC10]|uniref:TPM domain-containing protein n=1 Tax=Oribacterium sp. WCC10 TaxID=1855343 RepID=UPI0008EC1709|nr:TPM domain-containing protein [Oribacterium sp. WCC10]SFG53480.1 Uncharacterized membrane protein YgcG, contains a TPM-fold domain [Oribacterium sp. WCC10]
MLKKKNNIKMLLTGLSFGYIMKKYKRHRYEIHRNRASVFLRAVIGMLIAVFIFASEGYASQTLDDVSIDTNDYNAESNGDYIEEYTDEEETETEWLEEAEIEGREFYRNPDTGYVVYIRDEANLLTDDEEESLAVSMQPLTEIGNAAFVSSIAIHADSTDYFTEAKYQELYGWESGTMFMIDMDFREIYIHSDGEMFKVINRARALTITDNAYRLAGKGDYYGCANLVFDQMIRVINGERIAQPMKYTSNAVLAIIIALLMNFGLLVFSRRSYAKEMKTEEVLMHAMNSFVVGASVEAFIRQTKQYVSHSSGSSGGSHHSSGGSHSSGGFHSSGGGHHGGGGGHRF